MPVSDKEIFVAIVIDIEEVHAPAYVREAISHTCDERYIVEETVAIVTVDRVRLFLIVQRDEIEKSIVITIPEINAHCSLNTAILICLHTGHPPHTRECAITLIVV